MSEMIIIAHRGASGKYPENTLLAFRGALELGAKWLEMDVQLVDGELVVFHDESLERTTNGEGELSAISFAGLRKLDAGAGERVPLLREVITLVAGRAQINIELKGEGTAVVTALLLKELFKQQILTAKDVLASSLRLDELARFRQLLPEVRLAPIFEDLPQNMGFYLNAFNAWSVHLHKSLITDGVTELARRNRTRVFVWTVNQLHEVERLVQMGVTGIFTDKPEMFNIREC